MIAHTSTARARDRRLKPSIARGPLTPPTSVSTQRWKDKRLKTQYEVVSGLANSTNVAAAAKGVLQRSCTCLNWDFGAFWIIDVPEGLLRCIATWCAEPKRLEGFAEETQRLSFRRGEGLPGHIWRSGEHLWLPVLPRQAHCPRAHAGYRAGLTTAFGFPVKIQGRVLGVVEFFSQNIDKPDGCLLNFMTAIAGPMAQFMRRMELEEQRRATDERLQAILNNTTSVIYVKDLHGRYLLVNRQFETMFHVAAKNVIGKTDYELFPKHAALRFVRNDQRVVQLGQSVEFEETAPHDDGPHTYISVKFPLCDANNAVSGVGGVSTDITERKRAEEKLVSANAQLLERNLEFARSEIALRQALDELQESHQDLKIAQQELLDAARLKSAGQLAAGVAHEVKNPLQTILMGIAYLSRNSPESDQTAADVLADMKDAVGRADTIVRDLLALSSSRPLELAEVDLHALVEESLRLVIFELNRTQIDVVREFSEGLPQLLLDKARIQELFINLFVNAIHAMPNGGRLTVRSHLTQGLEPRSSPQPNRGRISPDCPVVVVEVQDSGVGISPEKLPRIFEPFFTTKPSGQGTGLGLPICKQIMDAHGGDIDLCPVAGGGVRARVTFRTHWRAR